MGTAHSKIGCVGVQTCKSQQSKVLLGPSRPTPREFEILAAPAVPSFGALSPSSPTFIDKVEPTFAPSEFSRELSPTCSLRRARCRRSHSRRHLRRDSLPLAPRLREPCESEELLPSRCERFSRIVTPPPPPLSRTEYVPRHADALPAASREAPTSISLPAALLEVQAAGRVAMLRWGGPWSRGSIPHVFSPC